MNDSETNMESRLHWVEERLRQACEAAGRSPGDVTLVAVSKRHPPERIEEAARLGLTVFGENRVQEAAQKIPACPENLRWHLIGHLQSNKAKLAARLFECVHSVDSEKLLVLLDKEAAAAGQTLEVFLQVNVAGEGSKFGLSPEAVEAVLDRAGSCMNLDVVGLMTMPPIVAEPEDARPWFAQLRELRDTLRETTGFPLDQLSMGMSHDFEQAILEGATHVRIGTDIFGKRKA